jgi:hypothetical protein
VGGSGGQQGTIGVLREVNLVSGTPTPITPVEFPPKNTSVVGG